MNVCEEPEAAAGVSYKASRAGEPSAMCCGLQEDDLTVGESSAQAWAAGQGPTMATEAGTAQRPRSVCMSVHSVSVLSVPVAAVCCVTPLFPWLFSRTSGPGGCSVCLPSGTCS